MTKNPSARLSLVGKNEPNSDGAMASSLLAMGMTKNQGWDVPIRVILLGSWQPRCPLPLVTELHKEERGNVLNLDTALGLWK